MTDSTHKPAIDYGVLDPFKRDAQTAAATTDGNIEYLGLQVEKASRGETAFLIDMEDYYLAHTHEALGTKILEADLMYRKRGGPLAPGHAAVAQDAVAAIVNDNAAVGALPLSVGMQLSVASGYVNDAERSSHLIRGWRDACNLAGAVWGPGETPQEDGLIVPDSAELSGSCVGKTFGRRWFDPRRIAPGDVILVAESNGIHANGLSDVRAFASTLPEGYLTPVPEADGMALGDLVLQPSHIYVSLVKLCLIEDIAVKYAVNVTGHGWTKLMRANRRYTYFIQKLPREQPLFVFLSRHVGMSAYDLYRTFNMGAGYALIMSRRDARRLLPLARRHRLPYRLYEAGTVLEGSRAVHIEPLDITYGEHALDIR